MCWFSIEAESEKEIKDAFQVLRFIAGLQFTRQTHMIAGSEERMAGEREGMKQRLLPTDGQECEWQKCRRNIAEVNSPMRDFLFPDFGERPLMWSHGQKFVLQRWNILTVVGLNYCCFQLSLSLHHTSAFVEWCWSNRHRNVKFM